MQALLCEILFRSLLCTKAFGPTLQTYLVGPRDAKRIGVDILCHDRTRADDRADADRDWCDQRAVGADECVFADDGAMFEIAFLI